MKFSRYCKLTILTTFVFTLSAQAQDIFQAQPQVAQNRIVTTSTVDTSTPTIVAANDTNAVKMPRAEPANLNRVGVHSALPVPLSLNEAIHRALESNNDIE